MSGGLTAIIEGPWGVILAILAMTLATFLCRISGVMLMSRVNLTPRMERGMRALPGSIIVATIAPVALDSGLPAIVSLAATIVATVWTRKELLGLVAGLGTLSLIRVFGF
jgi:uncharacterized membrane protein